MSKKSRKRNKKILAALALAGGAAMLAKGRGKGADAVSTVGQAVGVDRITPKSNWITKKAPAAVEKVTETITDRVPIGRMRGAGTDLQAIANQKKRAALNLRAPTDVMGPFDYMQPRVPRPNRFGGLKGGGIAKRGNGVALKHGGRVKSMGIAKRGGGAAKR